MNGTNVGTMFVELLFDDSSVRKGSERASKTLRSFRSDVVDLAKSVDDQLTSAFKRFGAAVAAFGTASALIGAGFEKRMSEVAAVSQSTAEQMQALTDKARQIGETTAFSASQAADALISLARAGLTAEQVLAASRATTVLAGAGNIELAASADLVAATLAQFSLRATEAGRVADVFTTVTQKSRFSLGSLAEAMKYAGTTGSALSMSLEETTAAVAQFVDLGLDGSTAGTNFREAMLSLVNPTNKARESLADLGLTAEDVNPVVHGFAGVMQTLGDAGLDAAHAMDIIGLRAGANVAKIARGFADGSSKFDGLQRSLVESAGVAEQTYARMMDNVAGGFATLKSSVEELFLVVFDAIRGPLTRLMAALTDRVQGLSVVFRGLTDETDGALSAVGGGLLAILDAAIRLTPYLREIGALMLAALVVSRGVRYAAAAQELAKVVGVDLVGAFGRLGAVVLGLEALPGLLVGIGSAGIVAGVIALAAAFARLVTELTGSAEAARRLRADLDAVAAVQDSDRARAADLGRLLEAQQAEIRLRADRGEALDDEARALLRLDGAQAAVLERQGELVQVGDQLRRASALDAETRQDQARVLEAQAVEFDRLAGKVRDLAGYYQQAGVSTLFNDTVNAPLLASAGRAIGRTVESYQDLIEAGREFELRAERERDVRSKLLNGLALEAGERVKVAGLTGDQADQTNQLGQAYKDVAESEKDAATRLKEYIRVAGQAVRPGSNDLGSWLPTEAVTRDLAAGTAVVVERFGDLRATVDLANTAFAALDEQPGRVDAIGSALARLVAGPGRLALDAVAQLGDAIANVAQNLAGKAIGLVQGWFQAVIRGVAPLFAVGDFVTSAIEAQASAQDRLTQATQASAEAERELRRLRGAGDTSAEALQSAVDAARAARADLEAAQAQASLTTAELAQQEAAATAERIRSFVVAFADALPTLFDEITAQVPLVIDAIIAAIPRITDAVSAQVPVVLREIADAAPAVIRQFARATPILIRAILEEVPRLIDALTEGVVTVIESLPSLADAILDAVPAIIEAATAAIPVVTDALIEALIGIIEQVADNLEPIVFALAQSMATVVTAVIDGIPRIVQALIAAGPEIAEGFVTDFIDRLTNASWEDLFQMLTGMSLDVAEQMGNTILRILSLGLLGNGDSGKQLNLDANGIPVPTASGSATVEQGARPPESPADARRQGLEWLSNLFRGGRRRAASGIQWAPTTMAAVIEPGEAVVDAATNARRMAGYQLQGPAPLMPAGGGGNVEVTVALDGEVVDAAMFGAVDGGRMPRLRRALRGHGVKPGIGRGRWNPQSG